MQSTNEELETTNEELKSLNEELEDINEELAKRSKQLDDANARYSEMVERMPWPMVLTTSDGSIGIYNSAAQRLFGFATPSNDGMKLREVPMSSDNHEKLAGHLASACDKKQNVTVEPFQLSTNSGSQSVRVHIKPMFLAEKSQGALVMFEPLSSDGDGNRDGKRKSNGRNGAKSNGKQRAPVARTKTSKVKTRKKSGAKRR